VDGWALTMLSKGNVGMASTCNSIGQVTSTTDTHVYIHICIYVYRYMCMYMYINVGMASTCNSIGQVDVIEQHTQTLHGVIIGLPTLTSHT
jgi:hypothetical protein